MRLQRRQRLPLPPTMGTKYAPTEEQAEASRSGCVVITANNPVQVETCEGYPVHNKLQLPLDFRSPTGYSATQRSHTVLKIEIF